MYIHVPTSVCIFSESVKQPKFSSPKDVTDEVAPDILGSGSGVRSGAPTSSTSGPEAQRSPAGKSKCQKESATVVTLGASERLVGNSPEPKEKSCKASQHEGKKRKKNSNLSSKETPPAGAASSSPIAGACAGDAAAAEGADPAPLRGKDRRKAAKRARLLRKGIDPENNVISRRKTIEEYLNEPDSCSDKKHRLELRLVRTNSPEFRRTFAASYAVYRAYQIAVHKDPPEKCDEETYRRFLCENPFPDQPDEVTSALGAFHHQYWLDGKLVAVGVVDVLPCCVSSKYFYYSPDCAFLNLGTYSALREIALIRELNRQHGNLRYYYMGFYIHDNVKMKYKGQYEPSDLLCPVSMSWVPIDRCKAKLDQTKFCRFEDDENNVDRLADPPLDPTGILFQRHAITWRDYRALQGSSDVSEVEAEGRQYAYTVRLSNFLHVSVDRLADPPLDPTGILFQRHAITWRDYRALQGSSDVSDVEAEVRQYADNVGAICARRMLLYRPA